MVATLSIRELRTKIGEIKKIVVQNKKEIIVTFRNKPVAIIKPITEEDPPIFARLYSILKEVKKNNDERYNRILKKHVK